MAPCCTYFQIFSFLPNSPDLQHMLLSCGLMHCFLLPQVEKEKQGASEMISAGGVDTWLKVISTYIFW